jgi:hypothetical protein
MEIREADVQRMKTALGKVQRAIDGKRVSTRRKMLRARLNPNFLHQVLFGF